MHDSAGAVRCWPETPPATGSTTLAQGGKGQRAKGKDLLRTSIKCPRWSTPSPPLAIRPTRSEAKETKFVVDQASSAVESATTIATEYVLLMPLNPKAMMHACCIDLALSVECWRIK